MNGKPTINELDDLTERIQDCWERLGRTLGVDADVIVGISVNNIQNPTPRQKAFEMLKRWHEQGRSSTRGKLAAALRNVGKAGLADRFEVNNWCSVSLIKALKVMNCQTYIP